MNIKDFRLLCSDNTIQVTAHALQRCRDRDISIDDIERCIIFGEIIEEYPDDYPYPSALICETKYGKPMHVVAGLGDDALWIITAYYPDTQKWTDDYLTRRESEI